MPVLQPADNWRRSGRYEITELFKLQDRREADLVLAMTHEEAVTWHVSREIRSYRDLPKILYHIQVKERDEPRPRAGVLRTREFIMKDSYSFDCDEEGLDRAYALHIEAYDRIFDRCGLEWYRVESDVGMGGLGAHEYMAPRHRRERRGAVGRRLRRQRGDRKRRAGPGGRPARASTPPSRWRRPARRRVQVSELLGVPPAALIKAIPVDAEGRPRCWRSCGRPPAQRDQAQNALGAPIRSAEKTRSARSSAPCPASSDRWGRGWRWWPTRRCVGSAAWWRAATSRTSTSGARRARPRLRPHLGRHPHGRGGRSLPGRRRDSHRARHRGGQHLQARDALLGAARCHLPGRERRRASDRDGLYGIGPARRGGCGRAVRRRAGHLLAAGAGAVRRRAGGLGQGGRSRARWPSGSTRSCARPGSTCSTTTGRPAPARSSPTRARGLPPADHGRQEERGGRPSRRPGPPRPRGSRSRSRTRPTPPRSCGGASLTRRRLLGLDRSGPPPPEFFRRQPLHPWTIPNAMASSGWRCCPRWR